MNCMLLIISVTSVLQPNGTWADIRTTTEQKIVEVQEEYISSKISFPNDATKVSISESVICGDNINSSTQSTLNVKGE